LKIEKKDLDLSLVGKHVILIQYILKANRRSIIKELELDIASIVIAEDTKALEQPKVIDFEKTFDGVDLKLVQEALKTRKEQISEGIYD
jgi:hypothetical protein